LKSTIIAKDETLDEVLTALVVLLERVVEAQLVMDLVGSSLASLWPTTYKLNLLTNLKAALAEAS